MPMDTAHSSSACPANRNTSWLIDDSNDQLDQVDQEHTHTAARLANDELIRLESTRDYFEQHSIFDHEASFEDIFGPYDEHADTNKNFELQTVIEEEIIRFIPTVHNNNASPWERFVVMDPVNEPSCLYGKQELSIQGLKLGDVTSATIRVLGSVAVATQNNRHRR